MVDYPPFDERRLLMALFGLAIAITALISPPSRAAEQDQAAPETVTRVYDVSDIVDPARWMTAVTQAKGLSPSSHAPTTAAMNSGRRVAMGQVIEVIQTTAAQESWGTIGRIRQLDDSKLVITQTQETHAAIATLLEQLRVAHNVSIQLTCQYVSVPADFDCGQEMPKQGGVAGAFLDQKHADELLARVRADKTARIINAPKLTLWNGQNAEIRIGTETAYVADVNPAAAKEAHFRTSTAFSGFDMSSTATVSADRKYVTITLNPDNTQLMTLRDIPAPSSPKEFAQQPVTRTWRYDSTVTVPDGNIILIALFGPIYAPPEERAADNDPPSRRFILVKPKIVIPATTAPAK